MDVEMNPKITLNLNEISQSERHSRVFDEFDALALGESIELIVDHEPKVLLRQFKTLRDEMYGWQVLETGSALYKIRLLKIKDGTPEQMRARVEGCCGVCGND